MHVLFDRSHILVVPALVVQSFDEGKFFLMIFVNVVQVNRMLAIDGLVLLGC